MRRIVIPATLALSAILFAGNIASADDKASSKSGFSGGAVGAPTMTLGGKGTPASAASAPDTEQAWYHGYYRGYRNGFYNGYYAGFSPYYSGFYPAVYSYPYPVGYYPPVIGYYGRFGGVRVGVGVYGINGTSNDAAAPAVSLNLGGNINPLYLGSNKLTPATPAQPSSQPDQFRYDGGPAAPIPLPKQDPGAPNGQATPADQPNVGLPVSLPKKPAQPAKPYTYKGYGDK
jgi:hypothetical protein